MAQRSYYGPLGAAKSAHERVGEQSAGICRKEMKGVLGCGEKRTLSLSGYAISCKHQKNQQPLYLACSLARRLMCNGSAASANAKLDGVIQYI